MIKIPNFTVEKELGRGGMATVYLAEQDMLSRNVALKVMLPDMARDKNFRKSFLSEGKIIANLEHPNIVRIHDFGVIDDSILFMAMEHLSGGTLREKLAKGKLPFETALKILEDTSAGLSYAHLKGYIHRDMKPGNILFREDDTAVITDFGIAKLQDTSGELTRMGYTMGTVQYMSPEQAVTTDLDQRSDIYSLGLVFYEMLTGQKAFKAESTIQAIHQHTTVAPPKLPPEYEFLQATIDKVLAKDPADRFQNSNEFVVAVKNSKKIDATGNDATVIHRVPPIIDDDRTQILKTGHYQVTQKPQTKSKKGLFAGIVSTLILFAGLAFGVTKYPEIQTWLNKENNKQQNESQAQQVIDVEIERRELKQQDALLNEGKLQQLTEKEQQRRKADIENEKQRELAAAKIKKQEAEQLERDKILAEKIASEKKQTEESNKIAESERQRKIAETELKRLETEKIEKDRLLAVQIANAKRQAEEDRKSAEALLEKIKAENKERKRKLAEQISIAKKQAEEAKQAKALAEKKRVAEAKLRKEKQTEQKLKQTQREEEQKKAELERLALLDRQKQQEDKIKAEKEKKSKIEQERLKAQEEKQKLELAIADKKKLEDAELLKINQQKAEQKKLDAEIASQRKAKQVALDKQRIADKKRKDKINEEKKVREALAQKKAREAKHKRDLAKKKKAQEKKRKLAILAKKKADAARRKQQQANARGQIRVSATLNGRPLKTTFIVTKNGKRVQIVNGRSSANFVLPAGRYVVVTQYSGKSSRANVHLEANDIVTQGFAFRGRSAPMKQSRPSKPEAQPKKNWTHTHNALNKSAPQPKKKAWLYEDPNLDTTNTGN